jgi:flagella synthesis protein FlgN
METTCADHLKSLQQERDRIKEFLHLLEREQSALVAGEHDHLMAFTEQKAARILELRRYSDSRSKLLAAQGLRADKDGMSTYIDQRADENVRRVWDDIKALSAQVRAVNEINGVLVATRLKQNQAAIVALQSSAKGAGVYGPDGSRRLTIPTTRALASA